MSPFDAERIALWWGPGRRVPADPTPRSHQVIRAGEDQVHAKKLPAERNYPRQDSSHPGVDLSDFGHLAVAPGRTRHLRLPGPARGAELPHRLPGGKRIRDHRRRAEAALEQEDLAGEDHGEGN